VDRRSDIRNKALKDLQEFEVLIIQGHFDYGNGYHGRVYVNPHQLFRHPATIWRFAQDLIDTFVGSIAAYSRPFRDLRLPPCFSVVVLFKKSLHPTGRRARLGRLERPRCSGG
jgi:hypothetical protein